LLPIIRSITADPSSKFNSKKYFAIPKRDEKKKGWGSFY